MIRPPARLLVVTAALAGVGLAASASSAGLAPDLGVRAYAAAHGLSASSAPQSTSAVDLPATPQAACAKGSLPETGRQGRVPARDYVSGRAAKGYTCNATVVGHEGSSGGYRVERYVDRSGRACAFYDSSTLFLGNAPAGKDSGVVAVDMTDPAKPKRTAVLRTYAMQSPHESLRLHPGRGLLVAVGGSPVTNAGIVDVYDVSQDCRTPQLRSTLPISFLGHEGGFSPDGRTYWAAATADRGITPIDLTDPSAPKPLTVITGYASHGLSISADGNRAYLAEPQGNYVSVTTGTGTGRMTVLDVSDIQARKPLPQVREVSTVTWPEVTIPQNTIPVTIKGRKHVIEFDEFDTNVFAYDAKDEVGAGRIIDISDEEHPKVVSRLRLAVHEKAARATDQKDDPGAQSLGGYTAHYCSVPRLVEPGIVACSMIGSGLRVFDVRDPKRPVEVAYVNEPLVDRDAGQDQGAYAMSAPAFDPARRQVWYSDGNTGLWVTRLSAQAWPTAR